PPIYPDERDRLDAHLDKFLPALRPEARKAIEKQGYLSGKKRKLGLPMLRSVGGWCVFFNEGCVLHKLGALEGDKYLYKPAACALFPLQMDEKDNWYVRQKGYKNDRWGLFCLDPQISKVPAAESLQEEIALARRYTDEGES